MYTTEQYDRVLGAAISAGLDIFNVALAPAVRLISNFAVQARIRLYAKKSFRSLRSNFLKDFRKTRNFIALSQIIFINAANL